MKVDAEKIKKLREEVGGGMMDVKKALEEAEGNVEKAKKILKKKGIRKAEKKSERETGEGRVFSYVHHNGKVGALLRLACETDFVAKNEEFQKLGKELVMQVASMKPENVEEFLGQNYVREPDKTIEELIKEAIGKLGENIEVEGFARL